MWSSVSGPSGCLPQVHYLSSSAALSPAGRGSVPFPGTRGVKAALLSGQERVRVSLPSVWTVVSWLAKEDGRRTFAAEV